MKLLYLFVGYFLIISLFAIGLTLHDKRAARRGEWRIRERTLLIVSALGGSVAMFVTMRIIHHKTRHKKFMVGIPAIFVIQVAIVVVVSLFYFGILAFNNPSDKDFPVRGVDVSSYQGEIDWNVLSRQGIGFAYIKATEGGSLQDKQFPINFTEASKTGLFIGAYHFFRFEDTADSQFANIIKTVPQDAHMLPVAVDVEFYDGNDKNPPPKETVVSEINALLEKLTAYYGKKPVIYATPEAYDLYVAGGFPDYSIWYRDVISYPTLSDGRRFAFWQFSNRSRFTGYHGTERYMDADVWNGGIKEWEQFVNGTPSP